MASPDVGTGSMKTSASAWGRRGSLRGVAGTAWKSRAIRPNVASAGLGRVRVLEAGRSGGSTRSSSVARRSRAITRGRGGLRSRAERRPRTGWTEVSRKTSVGMWRAAAPSSSSQMGVETTAQRCTSA